jgi:hypothetical protein
VRQEGKRGRWAGPGPGPGPVAAARGDEGESDDEVTLSENVPPPQQQPRAPAHPQYFSQMQPPPAPAKPAAPPAAVSPSVAEAPDAGCYVRLWVLPYWSPRVTDLS